MVVALISYAWRGLAIGGEIEIYAATAPAIVD
jgi:hypothetical protein